MTLTAPLVGAYHHRPAVALLRHLPSECPLILRLEPTNRYDPNAVMVLVATADIPVAQHDALHLDLCGFGFEISEVLAKPEWQLGYVARNFAPSFTAKVQQKVFDLERQAAQQAGEDHPTQPPLTGDWPGKLGFATDGKPIVMLEE